VNVIRECLDQWHSERAVQMMKEDLLHTAAASVDERFHLGRFNSSFNKFGACVTDTDDTASKTHQVTKKEKKELTNIHNDISEDDKDEIYRLDELEKEKGEGEDDDYEEESDDGIVEDEDDEDNEDEDEESVEDSNERAERIRMARRFKELIFRAKSKKLPPNALANDCLKYCYSKYLGINELELSTQEREKKDILEVDFADLVPLAIRILKRPSIIQQVRKRLAHCFDCFPLCECDK
jgi:hypothetical protein